MARPRKTDTETMLRIVDSYFESTGDPGKLKCSHLEGYAISQGVDIKAYDFRRNTAVRQRMEELCDLSPLRSASVAIAYKSLDVDAFLSRCCTKTMLRNSLMELDETWRRIYERTVDMSIKNEALKVVAARATEEKEQFLSDIDKLTDQVKGLKKENKDIMLQNRYLKKMLKTYLYPAIANEILMRENVLDQVDTEVTALAMTQMADAALPLPFSGAVSADRAMLSREEGLLNRMWAQVLGEHDEA